MGPLRKGHPPSFPAAQAPRFTPSSYSVPSSNPSLRIQGHVGGLRPVSVRTVDRVDPVAAFRGEATSPSHAWALLPPGLDTSRGGQQRANQTHCEELRPVESAAGKGGFQTLPTGPGPALTRPSRGAWWGSQFPASLRRQV